MKENDEDRKYREAGEKVIASVMTDILKTHILVSREWLADHPWVADQLPQSGDSE